MRELVIDPEDIGALHMALTDAVNAEGHGLECAFRCVPPENLNCGREHECPICDDMTFIAATTTDVFEYREEGPDGDENTRLRRVGRAEEDLEPTNV